MEKLGRVGFGVKNREETLCLICFPLKLEFLYCCLSPRTIDANGTNDNGVGVELTATRFLVFLAHVILPAFLTCPTTIHLRNVCGFPALCEYFGVLEG